MMDDGWMAGWMSWKLSRGRGIWWIVCWVRVFGGWFKNNRIIIKPRFDAGLNRGPTAAASCRHVELLHCGGLQHGSSHVMSKSFTSPTSRD